MIPSFLLSTCGHACLLLQSLDCLWVAHWLWVFSNGAPLPRTLTPATVAQAFKWVWVKIKPPENRRFSSMLPLPKFYFGSRFFNPLPNIRKMLGYDTRQTAPTTTLPGPAGGRITYWDLCVARLPVQVYFVETENKAP